MSRPTLLLATRNPAKVRELQALLTRLPLDLCDLRDFPESPEVAEDGATYADNARVKAVAAARCTDLPALADDSGLEVDALGGAPGIHSARFAGTGRSDSDNIALLLRRMRDVPEPRRTARFRCLVVVARPDDRLITAEGVCKGRITAEPKGINGFGYDPVFYYPPAARTLAEMAGDHKNRISHRAAACHALAEKLLDFLAGATA